MAEALTAEEKVLAALADCYEWEFEGQTMRAIMQRDGSWRMFYKDWIGIGTGFDDSPDYTITSIEAAKEAAEAFMRKWKKR